MFKFALPWVLILLPLPLLWYLLPKAKQQLGYALKVPFYAKVTRLSSQKQQAYSNLLKKIMAILIWILLVIAAAGPQWLGEPVFIPQTGRDIMLAVDLSGSMRLRDMSLNGEPVSRLYLVKTVAEKFIKQRKNDRLGLILFGTRAYLQTPLTFDHETILQMLDDATIGLAGPDTAIGDAIGLAIKRLQKAPQKSRVLILLTDGENNSGVVAPLAAAKVAKEEGIKIYTIGLGAKQILVPSFFGPVVVHPTSALDETMLKEVAKLTGGEFFRAENASDLRHVYQTLNKLIPVQSQKNSFRPVKQLYVWPLAIAFILSLLLGLWRIGFEFLFVKRTTMLSNPY